MTQYIIRLDDLSRWSKKDVWEDILSHCEKNGVKALIGVVPDCTDKKLKRVGGLDDGFWAFVKRWKSMDLAVHGFHHEIFGNLKYEAQYRLVAWSIKEFLKHGITTEIFIPPKHSYNDDTLRVLSNLGFVYLSDGVGLYPWKHISSEIVMVPQILWRPRRMPFGVITFCQHPDTMTEFEVANLKSFISENSGDFISIDDVVLTPLEYINFAFEPVYRLLYRGKFGKR